MSNFAEELRKLVLDKLKAFKPARDPAARTDKFLDRSTQPMGFTKITKKGYTP
jgi:hypothetical protein